MCLVPRVDNASGGAAQVDMGNPTGSKHSFNTQPTFVVSYTPTSGKPYFVYMVRAPESRVKSRCQQIQWGD